MRYRVVGISEAAGDWSLSDGDVVDTSHPAFVSNTAKFYDYLRQGFLVPLLPPPVTAAPETAMRELVGETMMRPRGRGRRG